MKKFGTTHAFRLHPLHMAPAALALVLVALVALVGAAPGDDDRAPDLGDCQHLRVPTGNKLYFHAFGVGVQIYRWNGSSWDFVAPEAVLHAHDGIHGVAGIHFGGPTWVSVSGSKVVGTVIDHCTPDPDAIPWLLLKADPRGTWYFRECDLPPAVAHRGRHSPRRSRRLPGPDGESALHRRLSLLSPVGPLTFPEQRVAVQSDHGGGPENHRLPSGVS